MRSIAGQHLAAAIANPRISFFDGMDGPCFGGEENRMRMQHTSVTRHSARNFLTWAFLLILLHPNLGAAANLMPLTGATRVAAGSYFSCALMQDATVKCWGYNGGGELGDGTTTSTTYA